MRHLPSFVRSLSSFRRSLALCLLGVSVAVACASVPEVSTRKDDPTGSGGAIGGGGFSANGGNGVDVGNNDAGATSSGGNSAAAGETGDGDVCGNSVIEATEGCDDGNAKSGDGCDGSCKTENGYMCSKAGEPCTST